MNTVIQLCDSQFNPDGFWRNPIDCNYNPSTASVALFDQNGYDLCELEIEYSKANHNWHSMHRNFRHNSLKWQWFDQAAKSEGSVLNHALIFERKGYQQQALAQISNWASDLPLLYKVARIRPKWGLDFSMDWADRAGNVFEIFHYEYDSFDFEEIAELKVKLEQKFLALDWDHAASVLLSRKSEWHDLDFFAQSDYKCAFFGVGSERFKMVAWE